MCVILTLLFVDVQELGIKHPLHRKKLQLALQALGSEEEDNKGKLDYNWVTSKYQLLVESTSPHSWPVFCVFLLDILIKLILKFFPLPPRMVG